MSRPAFSRRTSRSSWTALVSAAVLLGSARFTLADNNTYIGPDMGLWSNPLNWSLGVVPDNSSSQTFDVLLTQPLPTTTQLDQNATINTLTIALPDTLALLGGSTLTLAGPAISNDGTLSVASTSLFITQDSTLSGTGTLTLAGGIINGATTQRFINNSLISGGGTIGAGNIRFTNNGTIAATADTITITPLSTTADAFINTGTLRADGGRISIPTNGGTITNTGGIIEAITPTSSIILNGTVIGGTLRSVAGGTLSLTGTLRDVTLSGPARVNNAITLLHSFINNGDLRPSSSSTISSPADLTLSGGGTITLNATTIQGSGFKLTSDNLITGGGSIFSVVLNNSGTISALNAPIGMTLSSGSHVNTGTLRADNGQLLLQTNGGTLTNTGAIIEAVKSNAPGAAVFVRISGTVVGGTIRSLSGGSIHLTAATLQNLALSATAVVTDSANLSGSIANTGTVMVNGPLGLLANTSLSGGGSLTINNQQLTGSSSLRLTTDNIVSGRGTLNNSFFITNRGTISATTGVLLYSLTSISGGSTHVNTGSLRADGGTLTFSNGAGTITNGGGIIEAVNPDSRVILNFGNVVGGTIRALSGGSITFGSPTLKDVALSGTSFVNDNLNFSGSSSHAGTMSIASGITPKISGLFSNSGLVQGTGAARVELIGDVTLSGGGTINLASGSITGFSFQHFSNDNTIISGGGLGSIYLSNSGTITTAPGKNVPIFLHFAPVTNSNTGILRADAGTLSLTNDNSVLYNEGGIIEAVNNGALVLRGTFIGGTIRAFSGSTVTFESGSHTSKLNNLTLASDTNAAFTATLNLTDNKLILQSTDDPDKQQKITDLAAALRSGKNNGTWTGTGITSSTLANNSSMTSTHALALFDNAQLHLTTFGNQLTDPNSILLSIARYGDTNLDNIVDINDLGNLANHWQQAGDTWDEGDFNMDGFVDINDLGILASNWQQTSQFPLLSQYPVPNLHAAPVPEPATALLLALPLPFLACRRRKKCPALLSFGEDLTG